MLRSTKLRRPAARRNASPRRGRRTPARAQTLHTTLLGDAIELRYKHAGNRKLHYHPFNKGVKVSYTADRRYLVIGPLAVNPFIEG